MDVSICVPFAGSTDISSGCYLCVCCLFVLYRAGVCYMCFFLVLVFFVASVLV